ncbi:DNA repair protein [Lentinula edodes]|uniref:DNA repair protein RAD14 n=1 Tax=Lentinula edodes TaxID=5353 RepID=A0A1Q3EC36_LENED|nr:DNA repair protein [Lentinula edodes]
MGTTSASRQNQNAPRLQRDSRLGIYFEYDLSKMVNSKGGFLLADDKEVDEATRRKEMERERQRTMQNMEPPIHLDLDKNPRCQECQSIDIDHTYKNVFGCLVCKRCTKEKPERYSLLTKTECKEDYLLTDPELRDQEAMPHLLKANPHKSTFANMMLFLRYQVEEFAWKKWGSAEALDVEYERRMAEKKRTKNKKFEQGLKELRKRTREGVWQKRKDAEHKHVFGPDGDGFVLEAFLADKLSARLLSLLLIAWILHLGFIPYTVTSSPAPLPLHPSFTSSSVYAKADPTLLALLKPSKKKQWVIPDVLPPEQCELEEDIYDRYRREGYQGKPLSEKLDAYFGDWASERRKSPIAIKIAKVHDTSVDGIVRYMYWMKAKNIPEYEAPFQKCILSYLSDLKFIGSAFGIIGLDRFTSRGSNSLGMSSTIDHTVWFYNDSFDCGDWLLYVMESPRAGSGRAIMHGQLYTRSGTLVAVTSQEGVVRANIRGPSTDDSKPAAKL